ncbi:MAG: helicase-related protein [Anaerolineales bacterium]
MSKVRELHGEAMRLAQLAMVARHGQEMDRAEQLARQALDLESQAANLIPRDAASEPTRSILYRSAASLAYQCRNYPAALGLIENGLAGFPPARIKDELRELHDLVTALVQARSPAADVLSLLHPGARVFDKNRGRERLIQSIERLGRVAKIWFKDAQTGALEPVTFSLAEIEQRFQVIEKGASAFRGDSEIVRLLAEGQRLAHAYLFNPAFATETSLIDALPHQLIAVYDYLLKQPRLRFLLADDAGAGKTIMAGLYIREMLLRHLVSRVLIVPPAGLVGNWERELRNLFRLRFEILESADAQRDNPFRDPRNDLAIVSVDTLWRERMHKHLSDAPPYDLVIFDEAHKLSARRNVDGTVDKSNRYQMAEEIAAQNKHLLLLTATPHMGKDEPYYYLWRLLEPELLAARGAFERLSPGRRKAHLLRRMKEAMIGFDGRKIYPLRGSNTIEYPLIQGERQEQALYDQVTQYCETHYDRARRRNQSAARLAMGVLQRRLASSTWALLTSLGRRKSKLEEDLRQVEAGLLTIEGLQDKQAALPTTDWRETRTGDEEEAVDGQEESERLDDEASGATEARTVTELRAELTELERLVALAREVYDRKDESKFQRLWDALQGYADTKVLIFTEHRDTVQFLIERFEGLGLTGKLARIDGTMDYKQREAQTEFFRDPNGARYMVATDAAGEGINLQFCWLLVNYDLPWNPARLEQRMGRVHRYKQKHDVLLLNLVAGGTREGRVLKVLLDKLENIRKELGTDRVFDVIGQQFKGKSLSELIFEATVGGRETQVTQEIEQAVTTEKLKAQLDEQVRQVEVSEVRSLLEALKRQQETAEMRRMMPAYVRGFFQDAAPRVGITLAGDIAGIFQLPECPDSVRRALETYPEAVREKLTFDRKLALPEDALRPSAIYLHPGEVVFDAVSALFQSQHAQIGERGGLYFDEAAEAPYLFYLAKLPIIRESTHDTEQPQILDEAMTGIRRDADDQCQPLPAHWLMTLIAADEGETAAIPSALLSIADEVAPVETFLYETEGMPRLERLKAEAQDRLPERQRQLREAYNLREGELLDQRRMLQEAVAKGIPAAKSKLADCERELDSLDAKRAEAEAALISEIDRMGLGSVIVYVRALVLPIPVEQAQRRRDEKVEAIAVKVARDYEEARGATVEDVSDPQRKMGFDLLSTHPDGAVRYIEVKGRARIGDLELTPNEWAQANNHRDRYWLYAVFNCETTPTLKRIPDPAGQGLGRPKGGVTIEASDILNLPGE